MFVPRFIHVCMNLGLHVDYALPPYNYWLVIQSKKKPWVEEVELEEDNNEEEGDGGIIIIIDSCRCLVIG